MQLLALQQVMPESSVAQVSAEAMPCDQCPHISCIKQKIACWDYDHYLNFGTVRKLDRNPREDIYQRIMNS